MASSVSAPLLMRIVVVALIVSYTTAYSRRPVVLPISSISAAPTTLPSAPVSSPATITAAPAVLPAAPEPALSPDILPVLPSPKGGAASPTQSSLPIIPSSPSPPNPDDVSGPGPEAGNPMSGSLPESASGPSQLAGAMNLPALIMLFFMAFCLL